MRYNKIPSNAFKELQLNAGILLSDFDTTDGSFDMADIIGASSGGVNFTATPTFSDFADDIDNAHKNVKEYKKLDSWEATMGGTFATITPALAKTLVGASDIDVAKITPRNDLSDADFADIWWVGDYSDKNGEADGGYVAIHLMNALSTGGFQLQSTDKAKGKFAFTFTGHYSMSDPDKVPFEIYVKSGS